MHRRFGFTAGVTLIVEESEHRLRLDEVLVRRFPGLSRTLLRTAIQAGDVSVNGILRTAGQRVNSGDRIEADVDPEAVTALTPEPLPLSIVFEDQDLIVVDKPVGMVVHPAGQHRSGTLANALAHHFNVLGASDPPTRPGMVHRLDRSTSGLMVVAKTQRALRRLTMAFQKKEVEKRYLALAHGCVEATEGVWEAPIGNDPSARPAWGIRESGRPAVTRYWVRKRLPEHSLLELEPVTGRTNQLRLHCAHFGHPIVGDTLFGRDDGASRLFLHAFRLAFRHPETFERLEFEIGLPESLATPACLVERFQIT